MPIATTEAMSYIRINAAVEYDPLTNMIRQDGQVREAGLAGLGFSTLLEAQEQIRAQGQGQAGGGAAPAPSPQVPVTPAPAPDPWGYTGPATASPYYVTPEKPLEEGRVKEYERWVQLAHVSGPDGRGYAMQVATEEGAREALRLVQQWAPGASIDQTVFGAAGGPWRADKPTYYVVLPNGDWLNAASLLASYYNQGRGVMVLSDLVLQGQLRSLAGARSA